MSDDANTKAQPLDRRKVLALSAGAMLFAGLVLTAAVLPAEFGLDPLGLGGLTGIGKVYRPETVTAAPAAGPAAAMQQASPWRRLTLEVELVPGGDLEGRDQIEYKVAMKPGQAMVYSWQAGEGVPDDQFYSDFHGHTVAPVQAKVSATSYREGMGASAHGSLVAGFAGVHGWYWQNQSDRPVKVRLTLAGFFDLVPAGQPGNEKGLQARVEP